MTRSVKKFHLKREDAFEDLVRRSIKTVHDRHLSEADVGSSSVPSQLIPFFDEITRRMQEMKSKVASGEVEVKGLLESLPDEKLRMISDTLQKHNHNAYSEDVLLVIAHIVLSDLEVVERSIQHMTSLRNQLVSNFIFAYAKGYSSERGNSMVFNHRGFKRNIEEIQNYRGRLRQREHEPNELNEPNEHSDNRCILM